MSSEESQEQKRLMKGA